MKYKHEEYALINRAFSAYFHNAGDKAMIQPSYSKSFCTEFEGKDYVVLATDLKALAVYRIKKDGYLKKLKRYPKKIQMSGGDIIK